MEILPILRALKQHKTSTLLAALQIAVSLAIMVNAMFIINQRAEKINRPTGMDIENIITIALRSVEEDYDGLATVDRDLAMLRDLPGVRDATAISHFPLSGSGSGTGLRTVPDKTLTPVSTAQYRVDDHGINTLGANIVRGRNFYPEEVGRWVPGKTEAPAFPVIIITEPLGNALFPAEDALGKTVYWSDNSPATIIGIIDHMQGSWVSWDKLNQNLIRPGLSGSRFSNYLVRTESGSRDKLIPKIEAELIKMDPRRVIRAIKPHQELVDRSYRFDRLMANVLQSVIVLLVALTALVIVGLASYFVTQRTRQIGTRRALGATRFDILQYFLVENWLITTLGGLLGCILTLLVSYWLESSFQLPRLDPNYLLVALVLLWVVSLGSAYFPARRATNISPAIATRSV